MTAIEQVNALPEVRAKIYAEAFGFSTKKANNMCASKAIPCRKIGNHINDRSDNRTWMVNMLEIRKKLEQN